MEQFPDRLRPTPVPETTRTIEARGRRWARPLAALAVAAAIAVPTITAAGQSASSGPADRPPAAAAGTSAPTDQPLPSDFDRAIDFSGGTAVLTGAPQGRGSCNTHGAAPDPAATGGTFGRAKLADEQVQTAATVIAVGKAMKIKPRGIRVALLVAMTESALNPFAEQGNRIGLFQQPAKGYQKYDRADAIGATRMFYSALLESAPKYAKDSRPDWVLAEAVQGKKIGLKYNGWRSTAGALVKKLFTSTDAYVFTPLPVDPCPQDGEAASGVPDTFDPGFIISDEVFYNSDAMTLQQIRAFIAAEGTDCSGDWCLKNLRLQVPTIAANEFCIEVPGGTDDAAEFIWKVSKACKISPQVMLVTLQKESGLLDATEVTEQDYEAAYGWHCPDTGPGGTANCDPEHAGFLRQAYGMAKQWSRYVVNPDKYNYQAGETTEILYNVAESGCGGADVTIENQATASLYNYTPYQPNAASLAAYPGVGDACSTYGNRNFYFLFSRYFGTLTNTSVDVSGEQVTVPDNAFVPAGLAGKQINAPNEKVAKGLAAGLAALGTPYVWGGGTDNGGADEGCSRGGGSKNSCQGVVGFDCSGLTGYVLAQAGFQTGTNSAAQRDGGQDVPWRDALAGDIIGYDGHVAIYLGIFDGVPYMLEAPDVGKQVRIRDVRGGSDPVVHRYWS